MGDHTVNVSTDPQLFLDDFIIEQRVHLTRTLHAPVRLDQPVLDDERFGTHQPYLTVLHDETMDRYRMWYNRGTAVAHAESSDAIQWENPQQLEVPCTFGCSVVDGGPADGEQRYKLINWHDNSIGVSFSADGLRWTPYAANPVFESYAETDKMQMHHVGDIVDAFYDPIHKRYAAAVKLAALPEDNYAPGPRAGDSYRRLVGMSFSDDFVRWQKPWRIFAPDSDDEGLLEFYGMGGIHVRGSLLIGFVRVLRDELPCDEGGPPNGIGYTTLACSRDGVQWHRWREPLMDRSHQAGTWDHAMTWIGWAEPMGREVYLYYGGYAEGHKLGLRQIGLAKIRKDGYVSLQAGPTDGTLLTKPFTFEGSELTLNTDTGATGRVRVEIQDRHGESISGFTSDDCDPICTDDVAGTVTWQGNADLSAVTGTAVRLKFTIHSADLYAFEFRHTGS